METLSFDQMSHCEMSLHFKQECGEGLGWRRPLPSIDPKVSKKQMLCTLVYTWRERRQRTGRIIFNFPNKLRMVKTITVAFCTIKAERTNIMLHITETQR